MARTRTRIVVPLAAVALAVLLLARPGTRTGPPAPPAKEGAPGVPAPDAPAPDPPAAATGSVTGSVRYEGGEPATGAWVRGTRDSAETPAAYVDREGRFRLAGLAPGNWEIRAGLPGYVHVMPAEVRGEEETRVDFTLSRPSGDTCLIEVRWSEPPEADAWFRMIREDGDRWMALPKASGFLLVQRREGEDSVEGACAGFRSVTAVLADVTPSEVAATLTMEAGPGPPRWILVVDRAGRPVPHASVFLPAPRVLASASESNRFPRRLVAGPDGRLELHPQERGKSAVAFAGDGASDVVRIEEGPEEIVLRLRPGAVLSGRVRDRETGAGVPGVVVRLAGGD